MRFQFLLTLAMLCSGFLGAQISNFVYDEKVYGFDLPRSTDGKGYCIKIYGDNNGQLDSAQSSVPMMKDVTREIFATEFTAVFIRLAEQAVAEDEPAGDQETNEEMPGEEDGGDTLIETKVQTDKKAIREKGEELYDVALKAIAESEVKAADEKHEAQVRAINDEIKKNLEAVDGDKQDTTIRIVLDTVVTVGIHRFNSWFHNDPFSLRYNGQKDTKFQARLRTVEFSLNDGTASAYTVTVEPLLYKDAETPVDTVKFYSLCRDTSRAKRKSGSELIPVTKDNTVFHDSCSVTRKTCSVGVFLVAKGQFVEVVTVVRTKPVKQFAGYGQPIGLMRRGDLRLTNFYGKESDTTRTWAKSARIKNPDYDPEKEGDSKRMIYYVYLADVLEMSPYDSAQKRTFVKPRDNETANYYVEKENIQNPEPIYVRDRSVNSYFDVAIGTDLLGLFANDNANGKLKTEVSGTFNLFRSNARLNLFQTIHPFLCVTNFSREEQNIIPVSSAFILSGDSIPGIRMMQTNSFNGGISLDLLTARFDGNTNFRLRFTSRHWETPFVYTDTAANTSKNFNVKSRSYELGLIARSEVCNGRIKWCVGGSFIDFRVTNDSIRQANYFPVSVKLLERKNYIRDAYLPSLFFSMTFDLYISPVKNSYSQVFCKWNYTYNISRLNEGQNYLQVQVGYTTSFSEFLKSLGTKLKTTPEDKEK